MSFLRMKLDRDDGGELLPRDVEVFVRRAARATKSLSIDLARKEGPPGAIADAKSLLLLMKPHVYTNIDPPVEETEIDVKRGSRWTRQGREVRVLASGHIGAVCMTGHMLACEAMAIWPQGWPERDIVVYRDGKKSAWAYKANFVKFYERGS